MRKVPVESMRAERWRRMRLCRKPAMIFFLVAAAAVGAAPRAWAGQPTKITLGYTTDREGVMLLTATVRDKVDAPVADVSVTLHARTAFGWLKLAESETGRDGRITISLSPLQQFPEVAARTADAGGLSASLGLPRAEHSVPAVRPGREVLRAISPQPGLISPYPPLPILFVAGLLAGVWSIYGYVVLLLTKIRIPR